MKIYIYGNRCILNATANGITQSNLQHEDDQGISISIFGIYCECRIDLILTFIHKDGRFSNSHAETNWKQGF